MMSPEWYVKEDWYAKHRYQQLLQEAEVQRAARKIARTRSRHAQKS